MTIIYLFLILHSILIFALITIICNLLKQIKNLDEFMFDAFKFIKYNRMDIDNIHKYLNITPVRKVKAMNDEVNKND